MRYGHTRPKLHLERAARAGLAVSGALFSLIGWVLVVGGYLLPEGSAFDVLLGLGLIVPGSLLSLRHLRAALSDVFRLTGTVSGLLRSIVVGSGFASRLVGRQADRDEAPLPAEPDLDSFSGRPNERTSTMIYDWQTSLRASDHHAARIVPPATVKETGWDILLALHSDRHCQLQLEKLASIVSASEGVITCWLGALEERKLVTGGRHPSTDELLAVLTDKGRELLDRYFSATNDLQLSAHS